MQNSCTTTNVVNLKLDTLRELCHIFDVPPNVFVFPQQSPEEFSEMSKWSLRQYFNLNDKGIEKILEYIKDISSIDKYKL